MDKKQRDDLRQTSLFSYQILRDEWLRQQVAAVTPAHAALTVAEAAAVTAVTAVAAKPRIMEPLPMPPEESNGHDVISTGEVPPAPEWITSARLRGLLTLALRATRETFACFSIDEQMTLTTWDDNYDENVCNL